MSKEVLDPDQAIGSDGARGECEQVARVEGRRIILPGLASAHSHAFQRALRGRTQRRSGAPGSFWSWRGLMYSLAEQLTPQDVYAISHFAYVELALSGVTAVGEFHYVHHQPDGTPYADRLEMADAVIRAARDAGLRITLLRVLYERAGRGLPPQGAQRRFSDANTDDALRDVLALAKRHAADPHIAVGIAPHSVRAVRAETLSQAIEFARAHALPIHAHVSEQRREIRECLAEHGRRPVELLGELGALEPRFVAVHATHLLPHETRLLGEAGAYACICRTTERDLGDGLPNVSDLMTQRVPLCVGVDGYASSDPFEELRAIEFDERSRVEARCVGPDSTALLSAGCAGGYAAIGMAGAEADDRVELDADDPALAGADVRVIDDAVIQSAGPRAIREVHVGGRHIVHDGRHEGSKTARDAFERTLVRLTNT